MFVYTLNCPDSDVVMYVGKTTNLKSRLSAHIQASKLTNPWQINPVNVWIASLAVNGKFPKIVPIEDVCFVTCFAMEAFWTKYYSCFNPILLNKNNNPNFKEDNPYNPDRDRERNIKIKHYPTLKFPRRKK